MLTFSRDEFLSVTCPCTVTLAATSIVQEIVLLVPLALVALTLTDWVPGAFQKVVKLS